VDVLSTLRRGFVSSIARARAAWSFVLRPPGRAARSLADGATRSLLARATSSPLCVEESPEARRSRTARYACVLGMLLSASGCMLLDAFGGTRRYAFEHATHVKGEGLSCADCHDDALAMDELAAPRAETCSSCHDALDAQAEPDRRVASLFGESGFRAAHASAQSAEVRFPHGLHAQRFTCAECHPGLSSNEDVRALEPMAMQACTDCHAREKAPNACSTCHTTIDDVWTPPSHETAWTAHHGLVARSASERTADRCSLCHQESTCLACHADEQPKNHTLLFRERAHGVVAALDRQNCAACHTPDTCDRCHREERPRSHTASFGGSFAGHCLGCHLPLREEGCVTCHKSTPGHRATPKPDDHTPVMNCRQCHGIVAALPHADKGDDCNACHP